MNSFPNQTVSEGKKKEEEYIKEHFDYADQLLVGNSANNDLFTEQLRKFNGETDANKIKSVSEIKGKKTSKQFIDYRWHHAKLQVVNNEYLKRPLPTYVYSRNKDIVSKKEKKKAQILGAFMLKKEVGFLRDLGIPVFKGMEIPEDEDTLKAAMDIKTANERTFSTILKNAIEKLDLRIDFARANMHIIIGMRAFSRVELLANGKVVHTILDPRDEICEYQENDPFRQRTQMHGSKVYMTPGEIINRYGKFLTVDQIQRIYDKNNTTTDDFNKKYYRRNNNNLEYAVTHIEWKTKETTYWKVSEDKKDKENPYRIQLKTDDYIKNKKKYKGEERRGRFKIEKEYRDNIMESVRIGEDIYCMSGYKPYCLPNKEFTYTSVAVNTYDGRTVSLLDLTYELNFFLNQVQMQIRETIRKYVGTIIVYDGAKLPSKKNTDDVFYSMVEDSLLEINTAATGNASSMNFSGDHGVSFIAGPQLNDLVQMTNLKESLKRDLEDLTAINKERQGDSMASQSATGVRQNMSQSRVMTYHLNLFTDLLVKRVLGKYVEYIRISHAFIKPLEESGLLTELDLTQLQIDPSASYDRLGVQLANIEREMEIRERLQQVIIPLAIQREKLDVSDVLKIELSETVNEMIDKIEQSLDRYEKIKQNMAKQDNEAKQQQIGQQNQGMRDLEEDSHQNDIEKIVVKGAVDGAKETLGAKNQVSAERAASIIQDNAVYDQQKKEQKQGPPQQ